MDKRQALQKISSLVEQFSEHIELYKKNSYDEAQLRIDFINKFWKALGWDVENEKGAAEFNREVIYEDRVKVAGRMKAPDYRFRLMGSSQRKFFVEAKKPAVAIKLNKEAAYQLRRYGRSAQTSVSILTNFEEFSVYDCSKRPNQNDSAASARIRYITYDQYVETFDFIYDTFSYEAVVKGRFDKFVQSDTHKRGSVTLDKDFVEDLDEWRKYLATSMARNNHQLSDEEINFAVQLTIDRLIFLRFCEDRSVEHYKNLFSAVSKGDYFKNLLFIFKQADDKYNSGLFDFERDRLTPKIKVDNKVIRTIIEALYYPDCEYEFSVMPVEILGNAYEQFLGKVIRVTPGHIVKIEDKPEVRKSGGVYYTPQYIVEYIVKNTVGKLIGGKSPKEIEKIKIVDPACGSGSFLLGVFQCLLNHHAQWYTDKQYHLKKIKDNPITPEGRLTTAEKKKILLNNIFGVDLDANAVEVTKLSLLLKAMEGETESSIAQQLQMFHERVLPDLDKNILCGNSLIGYDFFDATLNLDKEERKTLEKKIKPFDWKLSFPEVFKQGGFDAVIGNPPYLKLTANNTDLNIWNYYQRIFKSFSGGSSKNIFQLFLEKVVLLSPVTFSFIVPEALLTTESNGTVRKIITQNYNLNSIVVFDHFVFEDATIGTTIIVAQKDTKVKTKVILIDKTKNASLVQAINLMASLESWDVSVDSKTKGFLKTISSSGIALSELCEMSKGMVVKDRTEILEIKKSKNNLPFLLGNCMSRYYYKNDKYAEYKKLEIIGGTRDYEKHTLIPRLLIRRTGMNLCVAYSEKPELIESTIYFLRSNKVNLKFLMGLLNSNLLSYYLQKKLITNKQGFPQVLMGQLEQLPIKIDFTIKKDKSFHDEIIQLVDRMLELKKEELESKLPAEQERLKKQIEYTDNKIDLIVYQLYGLTKEEIKTVEENAHV